MRILLMFLLGVILAFYLIDLFIRITARFSTEKTINKVHHSFVGFLLFIASFITYGFGSQTIGSANAVLLGTFLLGSGFGVIAHQLMFSGFIISERIEKDFVRRHDTKIERFFEILPGALTWIALTSPIWLSFTLPFAVAYLILLADIYWMFTAFKIAGLIYVGYNRMQNAKKQNWIEKIKQDFPNDWQNYYHLFLVPTYTEGLEIIAATFEGIANSKFPKEKILLGIGFEAWDNQERVAEIRQYLEKNAHKIGGVFITVHELQEGEIKGPATNRNCIVRNAVKELVKRGIKPNQVLATTLDSDFVIHEQFLAGAFHKYLSTPAEVRDRRSYTGVFLYNNNYWSAPTPMRVIATGTSFWQLSEMVGSDKYINFASLSMNLQSLLDIGLWIPNKVNDDAGFFWKTYYHYNGDYKVIPHFLPLSADAVLDTSLAKTFKNQYLQLKRWAYGVEHMPFIFKEYFKNDKMDFWDKTDKLIFIVWSYFKWGTLALFITFAGLFIPLLNPEYAQSVVYYNLSVVSSWILTFAFLGLFSTIYFNEKVAPPRPKHWSLFQRVWSYVQWVLVPIVLVSITTIPAIDAQTSLMFGRYLQFRVTRKARVTSS